MAEQLVFDQSLYPPGAVEAAAEAYKEHAQIELTSEGDTTVAAIAPRGDYDPSAVAHAFGNHVLYEAIVWRREQALREGS